MGDESNWESVLFRVVRLFVRSRGLDARWECSSKFIWNVSLSPVCHEEFSLLLWRLPPPTNLLSSFSWPCQYDTVNGCDPVRNHAWSKVQQSEVLQSAVSQSSAPLIIFSNPPKFSHDFSSFVRFLEFSSFLELPRAFLSSLEFL